MSELDLFLIGVGAASGNGTLESSLTIGDDISSPANGFIRRILRASSCSRHLCGRIVS